MKYIHVFADADELAAAARDYVLAAARQSIAERGRFTVALAGGSTPRRLYELLAQAAGADWRRWQFFMGDERLVPADDERSNQRLALETLLAKLPIGAGQVHAVPVTAPDAGQAAARYEATIRREVGGGRLPAFDLILLGLGSDGHTASLFPGRPALAETERLVVASPPGVLPPPAERVTFTFPLINAARRVLFLAAGADKAAAFQAVRRDLTKPPGQAETPAGRVRPARGELEWFVDRALAG